MVAAEVIDAVRREITAVEEAEGARVLYAVESGSRAWGFASADSDYDVRLVYVRRPEWYLSIDLEAKRDVIERQCPRDIDLSGWDIRKALRLFAKSNPPLIEWLDSPVVYRDDPTFMIPFRGLLRDFYSPAACLHHYLRMARNTESAYLRGTTVKWKKYFYLLRPLLAARWIEQSRGPVPMLFVDLLDTIAGQDDLLAAINNLLVRKTAGTELGGGPPVMAIHDFTTPELTRLEALAAGMTESIS